jgi:vacuolar-type H+-ATPase subunit I/STV1
MPDSLSFPVIALISLALTVLVVLIDYFLITPLRRRYLHRVSYSALLEELLSKLVETSREVDNILMEIAQVTRERESAVSQLGNEIKRLEANEKEYKERIETLKNVPVPAIDHLLKELRSPLALRYRPRG